MAALAAADEAAPLAGGATLMAIFNAGLLAPEAIVSLSAIDALKVSERRNDGTVRIGAMRRHRETAADENLTDGQRALADAAGQIGNPPVRNMGTIGGSVAFADPAADYLPAMLALDAVVEIAGQDGAREVPAADFFVGWMETALAPGELITAVRVPPAPAGSVGIYRKISRVAGDFATAAAAVVLAMDGDTCRAIRIGVGGCNPTPVRVPAVEETLTDGGLDEDAVGAAAQQIAAACEPQDDVRGSADYRRRILPRLIVRTVMEAKELAGGTA